MQKHRSARQIASPRPPVMVMLHLGLATLRLVLAMVIHGPIRGIRLGLLSG